MIINIFFLIIGFIVLIKGADILIDGSTNLALHLKIPKIVIGLTIVAFGTSAPEVAVSIQSLLNNSSDLVLGNVIGSNIINSLLILGICSLFSKLNVKNNTVKKELPLLLLLTILVCVLFFDIPFNNDSNNLISRSDGIVIVLFFIVFIYYLISIIRSKKNISIDIPNISLLKSLLYIILGIIGVIISSDVIVNEAVFISKYLGISERIISLTIISFGTSLPELITSLSSVKNNEHELLIGNIIGSNIFNICIVLGVPVSLFGSVSSSSFELIDFITLILSSLMLLIFTSHNYKINKKEGIIMIITFFIYYFLITFN